jgi:phosphoglycolate phosphatase-like HAD superfamily hydrolase
MTIKEILEKEGIIPDFVAGQDSTKMNKPYPDILNLILQKLKVKKEESVFVGNSSFDSRAGRNAGIKTIIIRPGNKEDAEKLRRILL